VHIFHLIAEGHSTSLFCRERTSDPGPKHTEGKKPSPGPLPGYLWGPVVLLTASGAEPPASSAFPWCEGVKV